MSKKLASIKNKEIKRTRGRTRSPVLLYSPPESPPRNWLYKFVYTSKWSLFAVLMLMVSFSLQGVHKVFADEVVPDMSSDVALDTEVVDSENQNTGADNSSVEETNAEFETVVSSESLEETIIPENTDVTDLTVEIPVPEEELFNEVESSITDEDNINTEVVSDESSNDTVTSTSSDSELSDTSSSSNEVIDSNEQAQDISSDDADIEISTTTPENTTEGSEENIDEEVVEAEPVLTSSSTTAVGTTTSSTTTEETTEFMAVANDDSEYNFNADECTRLASGSYYCQEPMADDVLKDGLYSLPDSEGDLEIYLIKDGVEMQVTSNQSDDAAPYYDQNSETIVWHRMIEDRYQIISYTIDSGEEEQLTFSSSNNMEPTRQGKYTVWQNWGNNSWDIVLFDGQTELKITDTEAHDVAPYIHGTLVVWNRHSVSGEKTIEMYDIKNKTYVSINDPEGLSVANPRMVFVYDSLYPNGDIVTKGYDVIRKEFIQLDTLPKPLPEDIPESESTGETRALIQNKPSVKSDEVINEIISGGNDNPNATSTAGTSTSSLDILPTLDLTLSSTTLDTVPSSTVPIMTNYDLVIPAFNEYTSEYVTAPSSTATSSEQ